MAVVEVNFHCTNLVSTKAPEKDQAKKLQCISSTSGIHEKGLPPQNLNKCVP